jgi:radical SAM superfamily enzyme YgiQ (UPF0313 family)
MKVYFADLAYLYNTSLPIPLPLNAGFITGYVLKHLPVDINIFKDPNKLLDAVYSDTPDVLALTHYGWNANLNMAIAKKCKEDYPNIKIIMGGPNFIYNDNQWIKKFFHTNPFIDLFIVKEGEHSFLKCLELMLENDLDLKKSDYSRWPSTFYSFDFKKDQVINNPNLPVDRLDLTSLPSPYLSGLLDEFLADKRLTPIIETNRGCPYSCAFCYWGGAIHTKIRQFELKTVINEIRYISERAKNPTKVLYVADANFGILKRDIKIAEAFMECNKENDFPKRLYIYSAKIQTENSMKIYEKIKSIAHMSMSLQSTNLDTLEHIGRKNIPINNFAKNRKECERLGIETYSEMIYGLPGESYETFINGISTVLKTGQRRIQLYAHLINSGAETSGREYMERFGFKIKYRHQYKWCGTHRGISTAEYEQIVVETNDMSFNDFLKIREFHFLILLLGSKVFKEFQNILRCTKFDIAMIIKLILEEESLWPKNFTNIMSGYRKDYKNELLFEEDTKKAIDEKEVEKILKKEIHLAPAAICKLFSKRENIVEFFKYLSQLISRNLGKALPKDMIEEIDISLNFSIDRAVYYDDLNNNKKVEYGYDVDAWLQSKMPERLSKFKTQNNVSYSLKLEDGLEEAFEKAVKAGTSLEESVYLLKYIFFPLSDDRIFSYIRHKN